MILGRRVNHGRGLLLSVVLILVVSDGAQANPPLETETARLLQGEGISAQVAVAARLAADRRLVARQCVGR